MNLNNNALGSIFSETTQLSTFLVSGAGRERETGEERLEKLRRRE